MSPKELQEKKTALREMSKDELMEAFQQSPADYVHVSGTELGKDLDVIRAALNGAKRKDQKMGGRDLDHPGAKPFYVSIVTAQIPQAIREDLPFAVELVAHYGTGPLADTGINIKAWRQLDARLEGHPLPKLSEDDRNAWSNRTSFQVKREIA